MIRALLHSPSLLHDMYRSNQRLWGLIKTAPKIKCKILLVDATCRHICRQVEKKPQSRWFHRYMPRGSKPEISDVFSTRVFKRGAYLWCVPRKEVVSEWRKRAEWLCLVDDKRIARNDAFVDVPCRWVFVALRKNSFRQAYHRQFVLILSPRASSLNRSIRV